MGRTRTLRYRGISMTIWEIVHGWAAPFTVKQVQARIPRHKVVPSDDTQRDLEAAISNTLRYLGSMGLVTQLKRGTYQVLPNRTWKGLTSKPENTPPSPIANTSTIAIDTPDIDTLLEIMFPNGVKTTMIGEVIKWVHATEQLIERGRL